MFYELFQSLRSTNNETNSTCAANKTDTAMSSEVELVVMSISVSLVIILVLLIILIVFCHNTKVKNLSIDSEAECVGPASGPSTPESGFIEDNNLLRVPEIYTQENIKGKRPSINSVIHVRSFIRHAKPKSAPPANGRPTGKPQLPDLDF